MRKLLAAIMMAGGFALAQTPAPVGTPAPAKPAEPAAVPAKAAATPAPAAAPSLGIPSVQATPAYRSLEHLMKDMNRNFKKTRDKDIAIAQKAAPRLVELVKLAGEKPYAQDNPEFLAMSKDMLKAATELADAIKKGDRREIAPKAFAAGNACERCHDKFREEEEGEEEHHGEGRGRGDGQGWTRGK